jgi:hypothetical protein
VGSDEILLHDVITMEVESCTYIGRPEEALASAPPVNLLKELDLPDYPFYEVCSGE